MLRVSRSGYYSWLQRTPAKQVQDDQELLLEIQRVHRNHRSHSGALKTWRVLNLEGNACAKHRVARLRQLHDIVAKRRRRFLATSRSKYRMWQAPNLLQRNFIVDAPNRVWVADVTHVATREGWLVPGCATGSLLPASGGLGDASAQQHRVVAGSSEHGPGSARRTPRSDPPF